MLPQLLVLVTLATLLEGTSAAIIEGPLMCSIDNNGSTSTLYILPLFNSTLNITSYSITGPSIECEPCTPSSQCRCIVREERTTVTLTAVSEGNQLEPPQNITVATVCLPEALGVLDDRSNTSCDQTSLTDGATSGSVYIGNGRSCYNGTAVGSVATYQCDQGYFLSGDVERICQCDGEWSGSPSQCVRSITPANIGFLVVSVLLWIAAVILSFVSTVADIGLLMYELVIKKVKINFKEAACAVVADIGLDVIVVPCLLLVIIFWALFGAFVRHPDRVTLKDSFIIAAFALSLFAFIITCIGLSLTVLPICYKRLRGKQENSKSDNSETNNGTSTEMS